MSLYTLAPHYYPKWKVPIEFLYRSILLPHWVNTTQIVKDQEDVTKKTLKASRRTDHPKGHNQIFKTPKLIPKYCRIFLPRNPEKILSTPEIDFWKDSGTREDFQWVIHKKSRVLVLWSYKANNIFLQMPTQLTCLVSIHYAHKQVMWLHPCCVAVGYVFIAENSWCRKIFNLNWAMHRIKYMWQPISL